MNSTMQKADNAHFIIPVFIRHTGCPHTCIFCNQNTITGKKSEPLTPEYIRTSIDTFLKYKNKDKVQISFYGGTFLGLPNDDISMMLSEASKYIEKGMADSIRFSTRPDSITEEKITLIKNFPVKTIEIGTQSMVDTVLIRADRGHSAADTITAVRLLKKHGFETGVQLMAGLPGDTEETILESTKQVINLVPDFVRIYPAIIFKNTGLAQLFTTGNYTPLKLNKCVTIVKKMYLLFTKNKIPVIRMGLQSSSDFETGDDIIAGPYHPAFGHLIFSSIFLDMAREAISGQEKSLASIIFHVNTKDISKMRGLKNENISVLSKELKCTNIQVKSDNTLKLNSIKFRGTIVDITSLYSKIRGEPNRNY